MPVLDPGGHMYHISGLQLSRGAAPLLVPAFPGGDQQHLTAAFFRVVNVPIVAAPRLKGHIADADLLGGEHIQIALPHKLLRKCVIFLPNGEYTHFLDSHICPS